MTQTFDPSTATRFLQYLDPGAEKFCFQVFPDKGKGFGKTISGTWEEKWAELGALNAQGFGIAVTINETRGATRRGQDVIRIRAIWQDDDTGEAGYPIEPSMVVQTSRGRYHRYWLIEGDWPADDRGLRDFKNVIATVTEVYAGDRNAIDISRALRLPGTLHHKGSPHQVEIIFPKSGASIHRYSRSEIIQAFCRDDSGEENVGVAYAGQTPGLVTDDPETLQRAIAALEGIDPEPREDWRDVGMALHHETGGSQEGFRIWDDWSRRAPNKYDERTQRGAWRNFGKHRRPKTIASLFALAGHAATQSDRSAELILETLPSERTEIARFGSDLVEQTVRSVKERFAQYQGHNPSPAHFEGIEEIAKVIQGMAIGDAGVGHDLFVSYLPAGMGKTTTVIEAIRLLAILPLYEAVGSIVLLPRVEEIAKYIDGMELPETEFSVIVSESYRDKVAQGNPVPGWARVLFTTQQMLEAHLKGKPKFDQITEFHFKGKPRQVRIWDESILPSINRTIEEHDIARLYKGFARAGHSDLVQRLKQFASELSSAGDHSVIEVPEVAKEGIGLSEAVSLFSGHDDRKCAEHLWKLSGRKVRVRREGFSVSIVGYDEMLPEDIGPLLILDASSHLRQTYRFWHSHRKGIRFLFSPTKNYSGLTIHHWDRGSGRDYYKKKNSKRKVLIEGIAKAINAIPKDENVLVVHFKETNTIADIKGELMQSLEFATNVRFCTWGQHTATNEFSDCKYVILASALQYPVPENEAFGRGAKRLKSEEDFDSAEYQQTRLGEVAHNLFQAGCRGAVRKAEGNGCPQGCHLYVIFSTRAGVGIPRSLLAEIFPKATIEDWNPIPKLSRQQQAVVEIIERAKGNATIPKSVFEERLGVRSDNLNRVLQNKEVLTVLRDKGIGIEVDRSKVELVRDEMLPF